MSKTQPSQASDRELGRHQVRALGIAVAAGILATIFFTLSGSTDAPAFKAQLSAIGGLLLALLIETSVKSASWTLRFATAGLLLGAILPWLYQTLPASFARDLARNASWVSSGMFSFGTAFLVKSAEKKDPDKG